MASSDAKMPIYDIKASLQYCQEHKPIYQDMHMSLPLGQVTCILGQSGCGKSSFLKHLVGLEKRAFSSAITILDEAGNQKSISQFRHNTAYMAQQDLLLPWLSVLDNVLLAFDLNRGLFKRKNKHNPFYLDKANSILNQVGLADKANENVDTLSGGMRQRVALARTLIQDKDIILMDEPFSSVDAITRHKLQQLSCDLFKGKTVLLVTHDPQEALIMGHKLLMFKPMSATKHGALSSHFSDIPVPTQLPPRSIEQDLGRYHGHILNLMQASL